MLRRFSINFALFSMLLDALSMLGSVLAATQLRLTFREISFLKPLPAEIDLPFFVYIFFPALSIFIFSAFALYDGKKFLRAVDEFSTLTLAHGILSISLAGILYLSYRDVSRALFLLLVILSYTGFVAWRALTRLYFRWKKDQLEESAKRVLVVGTGPIGQKVCEHIQEHTVENIRLAGFVDDANHGGEKTSPYLGSLANITDISRKQGITDVVIALPHSAYHNIAEIVTLLEKSPVHIWIALGFFDLALYRMDIADMAGIPLLDLRASALSEYQLQVKRAFDLTLGSIAALLLAPVMAVCALLIWLEDRGPVLFKQKRVGENGRLFTIYKFRTMIPDAEKLVPIPTQPSAGTIIKHKVKDDPRTTRIGRILRRTSLDELPQLLNILEGSMSLVGPRPELPQLVDQYQPWQRKRFAVPPGLTGWWQVNGRSDKPMHLHTEEDLYYINNYSFWLDIQILMRTVWVVIIGKGAY